MHSLDNLCQQMIDKRRQLKELEEASPEVAEALKIEEEYEELYQELKDRVASPPSPPLPLPYPVVVPAPSYPVYPTIIYMNPSYSPAPSSYPYGWYQPAHSSGSQMITFCTNAAAPSSSPTL